jgi:hypothetical protein
MAIALDQDDGDDGGDRHRQRRDAQRPSPSGHG